MNAKKILVATLALGLLGPASAQAVGPVEPSAAAAAPHFEYSGDEGPFWWGEIDPSYADCSESPRQSPIDIPREVSTRTRQGLQVTFADSAINLLNNGHTVVENYAAGSSLVLDGQTYDLLQFHFHTTSEHTVQGRRYPMELHAVFKNQASGNLAVIGQLFEVDRRGTENEFLGHLTQAGLPEKSTDTVTDSATINLGDLIDEKQLGTYWSYPGSLTTPPCSPIVSWFVLRKPVRASQAQIQEFVDIMGNNYRPVQPLNDRTIERK